MSSNTSIEWTQRTWNPFAGCSKISPGCKHCYAIYEAIRKYTTLPKYEGTVMSQPKPNWTGVIKFDPAALRLPYAWKQPSRIFVNSMSDLFHEHVPFEWLEQVFRVMNDCHWHQFQILTKRSAIVRAVAPRLNWTPNIWMGVSVENQDYTFRIDDLRQTPAKIKWISAEPLLGPLDLDLTGIDWVVAGGLSGGDASKHPERTELADWVRSLRDQCFKTGVAFFFKQWGGPKAMKKAKGKMLDGREWMDYPDYIDAFGLEWVQSHPMEGDPESYELDGDTEVLSTLADAQKRKQELLERPLMHVKLFHVRVPHLPCSYDEIIQGNEIEDEGA